VKYLFTKYGAAIQIVLLLTFLPLCHGKLYGWLKWISCIRVQGHTRRFLVVRQCVDRLVKCFVS